MKLLGSLREQLNFIKYITLTSKKTPELDEVILIFSFLPKIDRGQKNCKNSQFTTILMLTFCFGFAKVSRITELLNVKNCPGFLVI